MILEEATEIDNLPETKFLYSICTLVSRKEEYKEMMESFIEAGFLKTCCEFLYIDNSGNNKYDAFAGINLFLSKAQGKYIILCHQDILLKYDNKIILEQRIKEIEMLDKDWAIISNAGAVGIKNIVYRITDLQGVLHERGKVPQKVSSVDENFILVKNSANLAVSGNLNGFHLYGTDLCLVAEILGFSSYVVNFNLLHKSGGKADHAFFQIKKKLIDKYCLVWRGRYIQTTITNFYLSGSPFLNYLFTLKFVKFFTRQFYKYKYRSVNKV